jgi:hypothetical protein
MDFETPRTTPNVFKMLATELAEVAEQSKQVRQICEYQMAVRFIILFFGLDWYNRKIAFQTNPDEWMLNQKGGNG